MFRQDRFSNEWRAVLAEKYGREVVTICFIRPFIEPTDEVFVDQSQLFRSWQMIMKPLTRGFVEELVERIVVEFAASALFMFRQHFRFRRREHAIETAEHGHRQHHALVLRWTVRPAQQVRDLPYKVRQFVMVRHGGVNYRRQGKIANSSLPRKERFPG